jgi:hypothetical protein
MAERESKSKSAAGMVTASATKMGPMKHNFARIEIHPAANGFTVMHHKPAPEGKKGEMGWMPPPEPEQSVFGGEDAQGQMLKHIGMLVGNGKAPGNKDDKTKSGKMEGADKKDMGKNDSPKADDEGDEEDE